MKHQATASDRVVREAEVPELVAVAILDGEGASVLRPVDLACVAGAVRADPLANRGDFLIRVPGAFGDVALDELTAPELNMTAAQVIRELERQFPDRDLPDPRTVQRRVQRRREPQPFDTWDWRTVPPEEARIVLEALGTAIERSEGRISSVSRQHAEPIVKGESRMPGDFDRRAWLLAYEYLLVKDPAHLDASLAVAATVTKQSSGELGLSDYQVAAHLRLHVSRWLRRDLVAWVGSQATYDKYVKEATNHGDIKAISSFDPSGIIRLSIEPGEKEAQ